MNEKDKALDKMRNGNINLLVKKRLVRQIMDINNELEIDNFDGFTKEEINQIHEDEQKRQEIIKKDELVKKQIEKEKKVKEENYKKFLEMETLEVPQELFLNSIQKDGYYSKSQLYGKTYRGEMDSYDGKTNTGVSMYGAGKYTTTNRKVAQGYGVVRKVERDEMPDRPLVFKTENDVQQFQHLVAEKYGFTRNMMEVNLDYYVKKMGYDGIAFGPKNDMIIVKYY